MTIEEAIRIKREVCSEDGVAFQRLEERCQWHGGSHLQNIMKYGDPRDWTCGYMEDGDEG